MKQTFLISILGLILSLHIQAQNIEKIDSAVNGIKLNDQQSFLTKFKKSILKKRIDAKGFFPRIECINEKKDQLLRLYFFYGGSEYSIDQIEILNLPKNYKHQPKEMKMKDVDFITSRGIMLGMKKNDVIGKIGKNFKSMKSNGNIILVYKYDISSSFVNRYNQFSYSIKCTFKNGILISYLFGFEYA